MSLCSRSLCFHILSAGIIVMQHYTLLCDAEDGAPGFGHVRQALYQLMLIPKYHIPFCLFNMLNSFKLKCIIYPLVCICIR